MIDYFSNNKCENDKNQQLETLIKQDFEKRNDLQEAKKLERDYEEQVSIKKAQKEENAQEQGVDFNE